MKICERAVNQMMINGQDGIVSTCCWSCGPSIGNLLENDFAEIRRGEVYRKWITPMLSGDYSSCYLAGKCDYLNYGDLDKHLIEIDEIPEIPEDIMLGFESRCNYHCTCCYAHQNIKNQTTQNYDKIIERLNKVLPYAKSIYANSTGEVFASPRTMQVLNEWKPLAPVEECSVSLQSNGSLFTPNNWEKIKNIDRFNVRVQITVMSFDEAVYQHLSGTQLPISVLEKNLQYIRTLRERGIVNKFSIGSVVQEENFREMPVFIRRCFDEFGVDSVRLNSLFSGGIYDSNIQWFMDIRNPEHPYFDQYMKIIQDPIFHDSRVKIEGGFRPSKTGKHPAIKFEAVLKAIDKMLDDPELLLPHLRPGAVALFGLGTIARMIVSQYRDKLNLCHIYASWTDSNTYDGIPYTTLYNSSNVPDTVLVTSYNNYEDVVSNIRANLGPTVEIVNFWDII